MIAADGTKQATNAYANVNSLCQHNLIAFSRKASHHVAEDNHETAKREQGIEMSGVEERAVITPTNRSKKD
jgi:hypothetical protein